MQLKVKLAERVADMGGVLELFRAGSWVSMLISGPAIAFLVLVVVRWRLGAPIVDSFCTFGMYGALLAALVWLSVDRSYTGVMLVTAIAFFGAHLTVNRHSPEST